MIKTRGNGHKLKNHDIPSEKKKAFTEGGQTLTQLAGKDCELSILGDIQSPSGHSR